MRLTGEQVATLADFADGTEVIVSDKKAQTGLMDGQVRRRVHVKRVEDDEKVYIYDTGQIERVNA
jgi:hypothetical protein